MAAGTAKRWLKANIDSLDIWFFFFTMVRYAAFIAWADVIVRAVRREEAKENWMTFTSSTALITFSSLTSASEARGLAKLRDTAVEMRHLVDDAATQAELRDQRAAERDRQAAEQQAGMLLLNKRMVVFAALTLAIAIVALAITLVQAA
jgi:hypothetical protein